MRRKHVWRDGKWREYDPHAPRRAPIAPLIHVYSAFRSPIDGREIASRRALKDHERQHGVVQTGDWCPRPEPVLPDKREIEATVAEAVQMHEQGRRPGPIESLKDFENG